MLHSFDKNHITPVANKNLQSVQDGSIASDIKHPSHFMAMHTASEIRGIKAKSVDKRIDKIRTMLQVPDMFAPSFNAALSKITAKANAEAEGSQLLVIRNNDPASFDVYTMRKSRFADRVTNFNQPSVHINGERYTRIASDTIELPTTRNNV